jgi:glutamate synthase (NADPH/NADH) small chain
VVVYEKNDRIGGLLRYGIPDFKMEKAQIDRRIEQMRAEGVEFRPNVCIGDQAPIAGNAEPARIAPKDLLAEFDAVVLAGGAEQPRDLPVPGRQLDGIHFAMDFLPLQNRRVAEDAGVPELNAAGRHVVVIGGGDTGSDCVGTSNRQGAMRRGRCGPGGPCRRRSDRSAGSPCPRAPPAARGGGCPACARSARRPCRG